MEDIISEKGIIKIINGYKKDLEMSEELKERKKNLFNELNTKYNYEYFNDETSIVKHYRYGPLSQKYFISKITKLSLNSSRDKIFTMIYFPSLDITNHYILVHEY